MKNNHPSESELAAAERSFLDVFQPAASPEEWVENRHQSDLRCEMLDAFDQSQRVSERSVAPNTQHGSRNGLWLGGLAGLAACVVAIASYSVVRLNRGTGDSMADRYALASDQVDAEYLAAVTTVHEYREEVSEDVFFFALAMCEQQDRQTLSIQTSN